MKLFCLPYAGGGVAAYRHMRATLSPMIDVEAVMMPGRDRYIGEPQIPELGALVRYLIQQYLDRHEGPFAIYGHSMGALVGFELIRQLQRSGRPLPVHFFAAARGAPALSGEYARLSSLPDREFVERVQAFGGLSDQVKATPELMEIVLPILRNDFQMIDQYAYLEGRPISVPITTIHGEQDASVRNEWVEAWRFETTGVFKHHRIRGDHFFLADAQSALFGVIAKTLASNRSVSVPEMQAA